MVKAFAVQRVTTILTGPTRFNSTKKPNLYRFLGTEPE